MSNVLWVTWEEQRRNGEIAHAISADFYPIIVKGSRIKRYLSSLWKTFNLYRKQRPRTVICQNPSVVLALFTVWAGRWFGFRVGIDTHNGGLALDSNSQLLKKIATYLQKAANFIIITNEPLKRLVEKNGGVAVVVPDKIPTIERAPAIKLDHEKNLLFVCTYAKDEPYKEVFEAARLVATEADVGIYVTGRYQVHLNPDNYSPNLHFLGRIPWPQYEAMLQSVDGVIDLTTREYCLVCGAYEAVAVEKPLILSNTEALKTYFHTGVIYSENDRAALAYAIHKLLLWQNKLTLEINTLKVDLNEKWEQRRQELVAML